MLKQAVVLADMENRLCGRFCPTMPLKRLLGLSLVKRAILAVSAAGITDVIVVLGAHAGKVRSKLDNDSDLRKRNIRIQFIVNEDFSGHDGLSLLAVEKKVESQFLVLRADQVFAQQIIEKVIKVASESEEHSFLCVDSGPGIFRDVGGQPGIKLDPMTRQITDIENGLRGADALSTGIAVFTHAIFTFLMAARKKNGGDVTIIEAAGGLIPSGKLFPIDVEGFFWHNIHTEEGFRRAEKKLLNSVRKPTDGIVSRHLNRHISLFISRYLLKVNTPANLITLMNLGIGLLSAYFIAQGGYFYSLIGALLFQFASITDGCDGEVAKLTFRASRYGEWFDTVCDNLTYVAFLALLPVGLYRYHQDFMYIILGLVTFIASVAFVLMMVQYIGKIKSGGSMVKIVKDMEAEAEFDTKSLTRSLNFVIYKMAFMMRRDFFAFFFLVLCLVGFSFVIQWLAASVLTFASIYFFYYSRRQLRQLPRRV